MLIFSPTCSNVSDDSDDPTFDPREVDVRSSSGTEDPPSPIIEATKTCHQDDDTSDPKPTENNDIPLRRHPGTTPRVKRSSNAAGKRSWDKQHSCMYCAKKFTNITKHYLRGHKTEKDVLEILAHPKGSKERAKLLLLIRNKGDFNHNYEVLRSSDGEIIPVKCPPPNAPAPEVAPCQYCFGMFARRDLWRHDKSCLFKPNEKDSESGAVSKRRRLAAASSLLLPTTQAMHVGLQKNVVSIMWGDAVSLCSRNDTLIVKFGTKLYEKHGHLAHLHQFISQKMRELGRFTLAVREVDSSINELSDCMTPRKFPSIVKAVRNLCHYDHDQNKYDIPSLALKIGHSIKKCALILKSEGLVSGLSEKRKNAEELLMLYEAEWADSVSRSALFTLEENKWNKPQVLPLTGDISLLHKYLKSQSEEVAEALTECVTSTSWQSLAKLTLTAIILFNRRRSGEAQRLRIDAYRARLTQATDAPVEDSLSSTEKYLCRYFSRIEIRGKRGRKVPVLLTPKMVERIDLLLTTRTEAGVNPENPFVFARLLGSADSIRAHDCIREFAVNCGAKAPFSITTTKLRNHIATMSQIQNLSETELDLSETETTSPHSWATTSVFIDNSIDCPKTPSNWLNSANYYSPSMMAGYRTYAENRLKKSI